MEFHYFYFGLFMLAPCSTKYLTIDSSPWSHASNNNMFPFHTSIFTTGSCSTEFFVFLTNYSFP